ncbi:MAG: acetyl-CoA synthetase [Acidobacteria bacterium]|nr:MAG: acetyl-CoA synthetase [Acidobacteriota bacterium]MCE7956710.1 acetyl-CoA synthetase [Acidobacteria bacterium ACB2]
MVDVCARPRRGAPSRTASFRLLLAAALALTLLPAALARSAGTPVAKTLVPDGPASDGLARLLRFPDAHRDFVVFVHAGDLWRAAITGGPALRLTTHPGLELFPKVSPDGKWIAYSAEYSGSRQVWVMPATGGTPRQLTFYTDVGPMPPRGGWDDWVMGWTNDGKVLVRMNRTPWGERMGRYFLVDPKGGLETPLPLPEGGSASLSPDGTKLAYCPVDREFRTWKRTRGGRAQDVWVYDFVAKRSERITTDPGTDSFPMWAGESILFTSDRERTLNLYAYDLGSKATRKLTSFTEFDVLWPSLDRAGNQVVFMNGGLIHRLDLATGKAAPIPITVGADMVETVPRWVDVKDLVDSASLSPSGARAVFSARGDLYTLPAKDGATRNLTGTQGVREHSPVWSPDGKTIAYLSDVTGEHEVWIRSQDGTGEPRQLTSDGSAWRFPPVFSPDGKKLAFADRKRRLVLLDVATGAQTEVDKSDLGDVDSYRFSPDGKWLAYSKVRPNRLPGIAVWSAETKKSWFLGDGLTADTEPVFSSDGKHLFFLSTRDFAPTFSAFEFNYVYTKATRVYATALAADAPALFPPKSDEEKGKEADGKKEDAAKKGKEGKTGGGKDGAKVGGEAAKEPEPVKVEPEGFAARTVALPGLKPDDYRNLDATSEAVFYVKGDGDESALHRYDLKERKEEKVVEPARGYALSADGKKVLVRSGKDFLLGDAKPGLKAAETKLDLSGLKMKLDPRAEWRQMYADGWRITRDFFYDPAMHGFDWAALGRKYGALVPHVAHRADLDFLLGELVSELEAGHTYVESGEEPKVERVAGGMLGCELEAHPSGRYRVAKVYDGENWDDAWRSPLTEPGSVVKAGELILAIDGAELTTADNPYRLLEGKAGKPVALTVAASASGEGRRTVTVRPVASELNLRYLDWVKSRMALAEKLSGGKVGYIHLPDTALDGNRMLQKLFYAQAGKPALVVDDRYNGGGFIPDRMIEMLSRRTASWWAQRDVARFTTPGFAHDGPKAMLVNAHASSGGDALPYYFRKKGLGPLIGTRTWGGLIGLSGNPPLADGGSVLVPTFRIYDEAGAWVVENEGVAPDVEVFDLPELRNEGRDPSLEKAVELLLAELAKRPPTEPRIPAPPKMAP